MKEYIIPDDFLDYETKASADGQGFLRELVRCGECGQKKTQGNGVKFCGLHGSHYGMIITDDWYCADGERKERTE